MSMGLGGPNRLTKKTQTLKKQGDTKMGTFRKSVNKSKSANNFKRSLKTTKQVNISPTPLRGGFRL